MEENKIVHADSKEYLKTLPDESVDLLCTDPPYGYSFMGKSWDKTLPDIGIFKECFRVLKPGAFAFVMSAPRSDVCARMMLMLEDAGFEIGFTPIYWTYASGFPKAMNIGKMVDKREGVEVKEGVGFRTAGEYGGRSLADPTPQGEAREAMRHKVQSEAAKALDGSYGGFQPKPAVEVVIVAMKPLSEKTYVDQALKNGKGCTWLDECRVPANGEQHRPFQPTNNERGVYGKQTGFQPTNAEGRFPANLLVEGEVLGDHSRFFSLDEWAKTLPFLIVPKAAKSEKNAGLDGFEERQIERLSGGEYTHNSGSTNSDKNGARSKNHHPTVKPLKLMSYLITLGSRPGDVVLDPFAGSGTTGLAAKHLGRRFVLIEREEEYVKIAEARLAVVQNPLDI